MSTATIATSSSRRNPRPARAPRRRRLHLVPTAAPSPAAPATIAPPSGIAASAERDEQPATEAPAAEPSPNAPDVEALVHAMLEHDDGTVASLGYLSAQLRRSMMALGQALIALDAKDADMATRDVMKAMREIAGADTFLEVSFDSLQALARAHGCELHVTDDNTTWLEKGGAR